MFNHVGKTTLAAAFGLAIATPVAAAAPHNAPARVTPNEPAPALPVFSFLGITTENSVASFSIGSTPCTPAALTVTSCQAYSTTIGNALVVSLYMSFNNGKLYSVEGETISLMFDDLLAAFSTKYGSPAARETRKWQNKAGSVFDNPTVVWHFKDGDLELSQMGSKRDNCAFTFTDRVNRPPAKPVPINF